MGKALVPLDDIPETAEELLKSATSPLRSSNGRAEALRYNVMMMVVEENYEGALQELRNFFDAKSDYPRFKPRIKPYVEHAVDLINAIRAKRNFPGIKSLTMAKQQELNEKVKTHFDELQFTIRKIEAVQNQLKMEDLRSTVWIVRALINAAIIIIVVAFVAESASGLVGTFYVVVDDLMGSLSDFLFKLF
jgi:hypothetical protein